MASQKKQLSSAQAQDLIKILKARFEKNQQRHPDMDWRQVENKLAANPDKLWSLQQMEASGGEPDVIGNPHADGLHFYDCSAESPTGRRSICYDRQALDARKANKPANAAMDMAEAMGVTLLNEEQYRLLQSYGSFDSKTSSWILTPEAIRRHGGALFCDRRYAHIFTYHNGADSYYAARGFRAYLVL